MYLVTLGECTVRGSACEMYKEDKTLMKQATKQ